MIEGTNKPLGWFEKMAKPNEKITLRIEPLGLYAFPEEFQKADEAGGGMFDYVLKFANLEIFDTKFHPRQLTEEELWVIEEEKLAKANKGKKKGTEGPTPEELEKKAYFDKIKQDDQDKLDSLPEQDRQYSIQEDIFKNPCMKWPEIPVPEKPEKDQLDETLSVLTNEEDWAKNSIELTGTAQIDFEEKVLCENSGDWQYFFRKTNLAEDELQKNKKKAKGNGLTDLNTLITKSWVPLHELKELKSREIIKRIPIEQLDMTEDPNVDPTAYNFEQTYIKVRIRVTPSICPEFREKQNSIIDVQPRQVQPKKVGLGQIALEEIHVYFRQLVEELAEKYMDDYSEELEREDEDANNNIFIDTEACVTRRKQFIDKIYHSNNFDRMKSELLKIVKKLVVHKFEKCNTVSGVSRDANDQFYSDLYQYQIEEARKKFQDVIQEKTDQFGMNIVPSTSYVKSEQEKFIDKNTNMNLKERNVKLSEEYEEMGYTPLAEKRQQQQIASGSTDQLFDFCRLQLKLGNHMKAEESLTQVLTQCKNGEDPNIDHITLLSMFYLKRNRQKEALIILKYCLEKDPGSIRHNLQIGCIYKDHLDHVLLGNRQFENAKRYILRKNKKIPNIGNFHFGLINIQERHQLLSLMARKRFN